MGREYSNTTKETKHVYNGAMSMTIGGTEEWYLAKFVQDKSEDWGYGVGKCQRIWEVQSKIRGALGLLTVSLAGTYVLQKRKVADTEYLVDNIEASEQMTRLTVQERRHEQERRQAEVHVAELAARRMKMHDERILESR